MAYSAPPQWTHLDRPTAAKMNLYKDGCDAALALSGQAPYNIPVCKLMGTVSHYYLMNRWRWLIYLGAGRIVDPADVQEPVNLSDTGGWSAYDLLQVDWVHPGRLYQVQDVQCCFEDYEGF